MASHSATWDSSAEKYNRFEKRWHFYARVARGLTQPLKIRRDSTVLELASGTGACTALLAKRCPDGEVVCVEKSRAMARIAQSNLESEGFSNVSILRGDVVDLPSLLRGKTGFDFAVCNSAFWQFPDPAAVIRQVRRSLTPSGLLAFNIPLWHRSESQRREFYETMDGILARHGIDPSEFWRGRRQSVNYAALVQKSGLKVLKDTTYRVGMKPREMEEWRQIPMFARRWGEFSDLPPAVAAEIRKEVKRRSLMPWPENRKVKSEWRLVVAQRTVASGRGARGQQHFRH